MILGCSFNTVEANKKFAEKLDFPYPLLCDTERKIGLAYGAAENATDRSAKRITYVIGPDGKIKGVWGKDKKIDTSVHPEEVLELI